jgi:hypothetical protein
MSIAEAVAGYMVHKISAAQHETWGHLGPKQGVHKLGMAFTRTIYGEHILINTKHDTLEDSPWHFFNMQNLMNELLEEKNAQANNIKDGLVYQFSGSCHYSYDKDDITVELENMFLNYDCPSEGYIENSNAMLAKLKSKSQCKTVKELVEKHSFEYINTMMKESGIEELKELTVVTMVDWNGDVTQLTHPL